MNRTTGNVIVSLLTLSAVIVFAIYGTFALTNPSSRYPHTDALQVAGQFEASRSLVIAAMLAVTALLRKWRTLGALLIAVGLIELGDALIGFGQGQVGMWISPLLSGIAYLISAAYLLVRSDSARGEET